MRAKAIVSALILLALCHSAFAAEKVKILSVEAKKIGDYAEVSVNTSVNAKPQILILESPNRIAMAFDNATIDAPLSLPSPSPLIRLIQAAQIDENTVYVIVEPKEELSYDYASIIGKNKFILELSKAKPGVKQKVAPSLPATKEVEVAELPVAAIEKMEVPEIKAEVTAEVEISAEAVAPISKVTTVPVKKAPKVEISKITALLTGKTIVIDPGHGGRDPGYIGRSGILEKKLTLKISLMLKKILEEAGAKVLLTRSGDVSTKDRQIVALANTNKADLFVAVHFNSYPSPKVSGTDTYYFMPYSKKFASVMQKNLSRALKRRNRGIKKVSYYTVHHTKMPAVLVEPIYLTNFAEEKMVLKPAFQSTIAYGIYKGIAEYVKIPQHGRNIQRKARSIRKSNT